MRWEAREQPDAACVQRLMEQLNAPKVVAQLLCQRGIVQEEEVRNFFSPKLEHSYDPFLMKDMDRAVQRLNRARDAQEGVLIFGDYDVDGTTAVALCSLFFQDQFPIETYIPDRHEEGYGISKQGIDFARQRGLGLIVALDCGIRSVDEVAYAGELGIDFIVCDHHLPGDLLPEAVAVLDPKRSDCSYPFDELSGCGIGYKLCEAYAQVNDLPPHTYQRYLDLLALSIASDIVPIKDENRVFAYFGLKLINQNPNIGLQCLRELALQKEELGIGDLVFYLGPRINAAGRMAHARIALDLLRSVDREEAMVHASTLHQLNDERRTVDDRILSDIRALVDAQPELAQGMSMVFTSANWHKGVIGIAASRVIEAYYRPTVILAEKDGILTGSARSIEGFDIHAALQACSDHLIQFGGHRYAAGLRMEKKELSAFKKAFEEYAQKTLSADDLIPVMHYDLEIDISEVDEVLERSVHRMAPFGPGNRTPIFRATHLKDSGYGRRIGQTQEHLKLQVRASRRSIDAVGFGLADQWDSIKETGPFEACFQLTRNTYRGETRLQLMLKDIRSTNGAGSISSESV